MYPSKKWKHQMDRLEGMSIVLAVAEAGSLSAAARRQKMPLATVSRKVSELEAHLRTKLFNRSSRALVPTDAGLSYIAAAKRILADITEAERAASGEYTTPRGDLSVSTLVALGRICLQPILAEFLVTFPEVDVQLNLQDRTINLLEEHIDVALRVGDLADSSLIAVRVGEIYRVVCASPAYLKSRGTPKSPDDLVAHDCISYSPIQSPTTWRFKRDQTEYVVPVRSRFVASDLESACDAVRAGIGITVAFSSCRRIDKIQRASSASAGFSAAAATRQLRVLAKSLYAGQIARVSRLRGATP
jgi:DNA-binding transcriptional LysR family regulator